MARVATHAGERILAANSTSNSMAPTAQQAKRAVQRIALVALLSIALGFFMQGVIVTARILAGGPLPSLATLADLAQSVTWAFFVCTGVAIGVSMGKARAVLAGFLGFLFAPLALAAAKASQKVILAFLDALEQPAVLSLQVVGVVRAAEYGLLALLLTLLSERKVLRLWPYLFAGAGLGISFGGTLSALFVQAKLAAETTPTLAQLSTTLITEIGSPLGCAILIYLGQLLTHNAELFARYSGAGQPAAGQPIFTATEQGFGVLPLAPAMK